MWTADNRDGWHGGGEYSRYIADPEIAKEPTEFMGSHAHRVRVMPYLEGVPCAIHGIVFPDQVATFRPVEMVVFRQPGSPLLRYASVSTSWDPAPTRRDEMRRVAREVGRHVRAQFGFRGAFTIDGVLTSDGFRPTELNPRYGAGVGAIARTAKMPLLGISRMLIAGESEDLNGAEIEQLTIRAADATRHLAGFALVGSSIKETLELRVRWDGHSIVPAEDDNANATLARGPAVQGGLVRFSLDEEAVPIGAFAAPIVAQAFRAADELWGTGIGELIPATEAP